MNEGKSNPNYKHGLSHHRLYKTWVSMRYRCTNPNGKYFYLYGGKGVKVCERWNDFAKFLEDMEPTWKEGLTLDRRDGNGHYEPSNCRWATGTQQCINQGLSTANTSGVKGVNFDTATGKWLVRININKVLTNLGRYKTLEEAEKVRDAAVEKYYSPIMNEMEKDV